MFDWAKEMNKPSYKWDEINEKPIIPQATTINNTLTSTSTSEALSAYQGKILNDKINNLIPGNAIILTAKDNANIKFKIEIDSEGRLTSTKI